MNSEFLTILTLFLGFVSTYPIKWIIEYYEVFLSNNHTLKQRKVVKTGIAGFVSLVLALGLTFLYSDSYNLSFWDLIMNTFVAYAGSQTGYNTTKTTSISPE